MPAFRENSECVISSSLHHPLYHKPRWMSFAFQLAPQPRLLIGLIMQLHLPTFSQLITSLLRSTPDLRTSLAFLSQFHVPFYAPQLFLFFPCIMSKCVFIFSHNLAHMECVPTRRVKCHGPHSPLAVIRSGCSVYPRHVSTNAASSAPSTTRSAAQLTPILSLRSPFPSPRSISHSHLARPKLTIATCHIATRHEQGHLPLAGADRAYIAHSKCAPAP